MLQLKTYLRANRKNKKGESIIYFIVANEWISTGLKLNATYWDATSEAISKKHPKYYTIAPHLQIIKSRAEQCISNFNISNKSFNRSFFETFVFEGSEQANNPCFLKLINEYCNVKDIAFARVKHYQQLSKQIAQVIDKTRCNDITATFVDKFKKYLRSINNNDNTITRKLKQIKAVVHFAQQKGILKIDPLAGVKLKAIKGNKSFLTLPELEALENYYNQTIPANHKQVLTYFLFSCYTGLRFSDVIKLCYTDIKKNCVQTTQEKTNKPVLVPLCTQAKNLLQVNTIGKCFTTQQSQPTNRVLKDIMTATQINKHITYHCSRHTFGTLSITFGIPMEVVAELMGVDFATVKIYAQIVNEVKQNEMIKWERKAI